MNKITQILQATFALFVFTFSTTALAADSPVSPKGEEDFYKGAYAADGDYILNGGAH